MSRDDLISTIAYILEPWAFDTKSYNALVARDDATAKAAQIVEEIIPLLSPISGEGEKLREALQPFADEAEQYDAGDGSGPDFSGAPDASSLNEFNDLTVGDLRRARAAYDSLATPDAAPIELLADVRALVIAGREFWDDNNDTSPESAALDKALEAFSSRVPYENEPGDDAAPIPTPAPVIGGVEGGEDIDALTGCADDQGLFAQPGEGDSDDTLTPDQAWMQLCERDDRNSPPEYPEMCLIEYSELLDFMNRATPAALSPAGLKEEG